MDRLLPISIDFIVFSYQENTIKTLTIRRDEEPHKNEWAVPGFLLKENLDLKITVEDQLCEWFGSVPFYSQVETYGTVDRHPSGHIFTISYFVLLGDHKLIGGFNKDRVKWVSPLSAEKLAFDHSELVTSAYEHLVDKSSILPIIFHLLPKYFKLPDLASIYECLHEEHFDKRNFIRKVKSMNILTDSGKQENGVKNRPAHLYYFDQKKYDHFLFRGNKFRL